MIIGEHIPTAFPTATINETSHGSCFCQLSFCFKQNIPETSQCFKKFVLTSVTEYILLCGINGQDHPSLPGLMICYFLSSKFDANLISTNQSGSMVDGHAISQLHNTCRLMGC